MGTDIFASVHARVSAVTDRLTFDALHHLARETAAVRRALEEAAADANNERRGDRSVQGGGS